MTRISGIGLRSFPEPAYKTWPETESGRKKNGIDRFSREGPPQRRRPAPYSVFCQGAAPRETQSPPFADTFVDLERTDHIEFDGQNLTGSMFVPGTGARGQFRDDAAFKEIFFS
jgi:hypothetical protein